MFCNRRLLSIGGKLCEASICTNKLLASIFLKFDGGSQEARFLDPTIFP
jgi:hypothetical protein